MSQRLAHCGGRPAAGARMASMDACATSFMNAITTSPAGMRRIAPVHAADEVRAHPRDLGADVLCLLEEDGVRVAQLPESRRG